MCMFLDEASYWAKKVVNISDMNLLPLVPDQDDNFGDSIVLDISKRWRHVQPKNSHDNYEKINSRVSFSLLYGYGNPLSSPSGNRRSAILRNKSLTLTNANND